MRYSVPISTERLVTVLPRSANPVGGTAKRAIDIILSFTAIIALLPLFLGCALLVYLTSPGPVLFRHRRVGVGGRDFGCLKFRTMAADAERRLNEYLRLNPEAHQEWRAHRKLRFDPRVTPFGHFMRRSSLDELPQLFNVLKGDMSLVGPRPIVDEEIEKYQEHFALYASARPGLTGLWQVSGRNTTSYAQRVAYDVDYLTNWSLFRDIRIIFATVAHIVHGRGAY